MHTMIGTVVFSVLLNTPLQAADRPIYLDGVQTRYSARVIGGVTYIPLRIVTSMRAKYASVGGKILIRSVDLAESNQLARLAAKDLMPKDEVRKWTRDVSNWVEKSMILTELLDESDWSPDRPLITPRESIDAEVNRSLRLLRGFVGQAREQCKSLDADPYSVVRLSELVQNLDFELELFAALEDSAEDCLEKGPMLSLMRQVADHRKAGEGLWTAIAMHESALLRWSDLLAPRPPERLSTPSQE